MLAEVASIGSLSSEESGTENLQGSGSVSISDLASIPESEKPGNEWIMNQLNFSNSEICFELGQSMPTSKSTSDLLSPTNSSKRAEIRYMRNQLASSKPPGARHPSYLVCNVDGSSTPPTDKYTEEQRSWLWEVYTDDVKSINDLKSRIRRQVTILVDSGLYQEKKIDLLKQLAEEYFLDSLKVILGKILNEGKPNFPEFYRNKIEPDMILSRIDNMPDFGTLIDSTILSSSSGSETVSSEDESSSERAARPCTDAWPGDGVNVIIGIQVNEFLKTLWDRYKASSANWEKFISYQRDNEKKKAGTKGRNLTMHEEYLFKILRDEKPFSKKVRSSGTFEGWSARIIELWEADRPSEFDEHLTTYGLQPEVDFSSSMAMEEIEAHKAKVKRVAARAAKSAPKPSQKPTDSTSSLELKEQSGASKSGAPSENSESSTEEDSEGANEEEDAMSIEASSSLLGSPKHSETGSNLGNPNAPAPIEEEEKSMDTSDKKADNVYIVRMDMSNMPALLSHASLHDLDRNLVANPNFVGDDKRWKSKGTIHERHKDYDLTRLSYVIPTPNSQQAGRTSMDGRNFPSHVTISYHDYVKKHPITVRPGFGMPLAMDQTQAILQWCGLPFLDEEQIIANFDQDLIRRIQKQEMERNAQDAILPAPKTKAAVKSYDSLSFDVSVTNKSSRASVPLGGSPFGTRPASTDVRSRLPPILKEAREKASGYDQKAVINVPLGAINSDGDFADPRLRWPNPPTVTEGLIFMEQVSIRSPPDPNWRSEGHITRYAYRSIFGQSVEPPISSRNLDELELFGNKKDFQSKEIPSEVNEWAQSELIPPNARVHITPQGAYCYLFKTKDKDGNKIQDRRAYFDDESKPYGTMSNADIILYWQKHSPNEDLKRTFYEVNTGALDHSFNKKLLDWIHQWQNEENWPMPLPKKKPSSMRLSDKVLYLVELDIWWLSGVRPYKVEEPEEDWLKRWYLNQAASWFAENKFCNAFQNWAEKGEDPVVNVAPASEPSKSKAGKVPGEPSKAPQEPISPGLSEPLRKSASISELPDYPEDDVDAGDKPSPQKVTAKPKTDTESAKLKASKTILDLASKLKDPYQLALARYLKHKPTEVDPELITGTVEEAQLGMTVASLNDPLTLRIVEVHKDKTHTRLTSTQYEYFRVELLTQLNKLVKSKRVTPERVHIKEIKFTKGDETYVVAANNDSYLWLQVNLNGIIRDLEVGCKTGDVVKECRLTFYVDQSFRNILPDKLVDNIKHSNRNRFQWLDTPKGGLRHEGRLVLFDANCTHEQAHEALQGGEPFPIACGFGAVKPYRANPPAYLAHQAHTKVTNAARIYAKAHPDSRDTDEVVKEFLDKPVVVELDEAVKTEATNEPSAVKELRRELQKYSKDWLQPISVDIDTEALLKSTKGDFKKYQNSVYKRELEAKKRGRTITPVSEDKLAIKTTSDVYIELERLKKEMEDEIDRLADTEYYAQQRDEIREATARRIKLLRDNIGQLAIIRAANQIAQTSPTPAESIQRKRGPPPSSRSASQLVPANKKGKRSKSRSRTREPSGSRKSGDFRKVKEAQLGDFVTPARTEPEIVAQVAPGRNPKFKIPPKPEADKKARGKKGKRGRK